MHKKIGTMDLFKSNTHVLGLCVLLLSSKGYCVTSSQLEGIEDTFIERWWQCIQVVSDNVPLDISNWIRECMDKRSSSRYSIIFCQSRDPVSSTDFLINHLSCKGRILELSEQDQLFPSEMWHKDDAVRQTMLVHD